MKSYDHKKIEKKWQKFWDKEQIYKAVDNSDKPKFYGLIEFPFPSGSGMHVGHLRSNTGMDVISRKRRMEGYNVLYPIGWDAFGLPTENYAIKTGKHPKKVTKENTDNFRRQLKSAGFSFDWSREINTTDPEYYKWTQWIFLQMYKHDLAYKKRMVVNWCPKDKIVLANEEVIDGKCERCGTPVEKREKEQWMLAITKYADRLDKDLDSVDYLEKIKIQQRNWIGKSEGAEISFELKFKNPEDNNRRGPNGEKAAIPVFTTRADTLFGATYIVLAPEHLWVTLATDDNHHVLENKDEVKAYVAAAKKKDEMERTAADKTKTGVEIKGVKAINPATGEEIPMFVADYVLAHYGTGAVMAVPAHDERDFTFAKKYNLPIKTVVESLIVKEDGTDAVQKDKPFVERNATMCLIKHWSEDTFLCSKWKTNDWQGFITGGIEEGEDLATTAIREIEEETGYTSAKFIKKLGTVQSQFFHDVKKVNRFAHFNVVYLELQNGDRKEVAEEEQKLLETEWIPRNKVRDFVNRPDLKLAWDMLSPDFVYTNDGVLVDSGEFSKKDSDQARTEIAKKFGKVVTTYKLRDWVFSRQRYWGEPIPMVFCEHCEKEKGNGWVPVPEEDLPVKLPEVEKYEPTDTGESPLAAMTKWVNTKCPVCKNPARRETDTMPNWAGSSWYFLRYVDPENKKAFADRKKLDYWTPVDWYNGGMEHTTLHLLYSRFWHKFLFDIGEVPTSEPYKKRTSHGLILADDGSKFSKSKGNGVDPDKIIESAGADALRLYQMFMGPFDQAVSWTDDGIVGPRRFLERVWKLQEKVVPKVPFDADLESLIHQTIKKVTDDIENMAFNTAVSSLMILLNSLEKKEQLAQSYYLHFLKLLAPFAPHITEEIWHDFDQKGSIHQASWDKPNMAKIKASTAKIIVQVNGKVRAEFTADPEIAEADAVEKAKTMPEVQKWLDGKEIKKVIFVKGKLINIVVI